MAQQGTKWLRRLYNPNVDIEKFYNESPWQVCAVGEVLDSISPQFVVKIAPNGLGQGPSDESLKRLGYKFSGFVSRGNRKAALRTYFAIQRRVAQLVEILK